MSGVDGESDSALDWLGTVERSRRVAGLRRDLSPRSRLSRILDLASNDYLGLSGDPYVLRAAHEALDVWGAGSTGSRLVTGDTTLHHACERDLATFTGHDSALIFSSGYMANLAAVTALSGRGDYIISDGGSHASLIDACRLSRSEVVVAERGDVRGIAAAAETIRSDHPTVRVTIISDSVYSIDGKLAPIASLYELARQFRAVLIVDEAHGLGVRGGGAGFVAELGLSGAPDLVVTATLSKALASQGGVVLCSNAVRSHLIDQARPFIFDTGLSPVSVASAAAALSIISDNPGISNRVLEHAQTISKMLRENGIDASEPTSAVVSLILGSPERAVATATTCLANGVQVGCFRPPSVPIGTSRLRLTARANLTHGDIAHAVAVITSAIESTRGVA